MYVLLLIGCAFLMLSLLSIAMLLLQARKLQAKSEKICSIALMQITKYLSDWGTELFEMYKLPSLDTKESSTTVSSIHHKAILDRLLVMRNEVVATQKEWKNTLQEISTSEQATSKKIQDAIQTFESLKSEASQLEDAMQKEQR
jgi:hypothetical protein